MTEGTPGFFERVATVLDDVRPSLRADGGDIELISAEETTGRVEVRMTGACRHCPSAVFTLSYAVEARLKEALPGIRDIVPI